MDSFIESEFCFHENQTYTTAASSKSEGVLIRIIHESILMLSVLLPS